jgi:hypothetical protein
MDTKSIVQWGVIIPRTVLLLPTAATLVDNQLARIRSVAANELITNIVLHQQGLLLPYPLVVPFLQY